MKSITTFAVLSALLLPLFALHADPNQDPMVPHWIPRPVVHSGDIWQASYRWSGPGEPPAHQAVDVVTHCHVDRSQWMYSYGVWGVVKQTANGSILMARTPPTRGGIYSKSDLRPFVVWFSLPHAPKPIIRRKNGPSWPEGALRPTHAQFF